MGAAPPTFAGGSPSAVDPTTFGVTVAAGPTVGGSSRARTRYGPGARSPLPHLAVLLLTGIATIAILAAGIWSVDDDAPRSVERSDRLTVVLFLCFLALFVVCLLWVRRIGANEGSFGVRLAVGALFPWELVAISFLLGNSIDRTTGIASMVMALAIVVAMGLLVRRPFAAAIVRACRMPSVLSLLLWVGATVGLAVLVGALLDVFVKADAGLLLTADRTRSLGIAGRVADVTLLLSVVATFAVLVVASIVQHLGIAADRQVRMAEMEARQRAR